MLFPPHWLCAYIVRFIPLHRRNDLHSLLTVSKSFHDVVEPLVYSHVIFTDIHRLTLFINTLTSSSNTLANGELRLAKLVRTFGVNLSELRSRAPLHVPIVLRRDFWEAVRRVLSAMQALECLILAQIPGLRLDFSWILDDHDGSILPFALKEAKLHVAFDNHVARFLNTQSSKGKLKVVQLSSSNVTAVPRVSDALRALDPSNAAPRSGGGNQQQGAVEATEIELCLPDVEILNIPLSTIPHINTSTLLNLSNLQLVIDLPTKGMHVSTLVDALSHLLLADHPVANIPLSSTMAASSTKGTNIPKRKLVGLSIVDLSASLSIELLTHITTSPLLSELTDTLHHISHLHYPKPYPSHSPTRQEFFNSLISFRNLRTIELSLNSWGDCLSPSPSASTRTPIPPSPAAQKALVTELRMYAPSLRIIFLWIGKMKFRWAYFDEQEPRIKVLRRGERPSWDLQGPEVEPVILQRTKGRTVGRGPDEEETKVAREEGIVQDGDDILNVKPRLDNAVVAGEWHYRMDVNQSPGLSTLWSSTTC